MKVFDFAPEDYIEEYSQKGYVHVKGGVCKEFLKYALSFTKKSIENEMETSLDEWRFVGKKMQFLFDFPDSTDLELDVKSVVGKVTSFPHGRVTICERHIKVYDDTAAPNPPAHKDRSASEVTVGLPLQVPDNSYLILYPDSHLDINHFSSTALYRSSLDEHELPEVVLKDIEPTKLNVWPGDVVLFRGSSIYHERVNPANTQLLYLKFNSMLLDPIGEDPETIRLGDISKQKIVTISDEQLLSANLVVSPKLDKLSRHNSRLNWQEIYQIYLWGEKEITVGEFEFRFIQSIGKTNTVSNILQNINVAADENTIAKIRRLINLNIIYLLEN